MKRATELSLLHATITRLIAQCSQIWPVKNCIIGMRPYYCSVLGHY